MVAFALTGVPLLLALVAQGLIWVIPGCSPNLYALGACIVGRYNIAAALMIVGIGGVYLTILSVLVSGPLLLVAWVLSRRSEKQVVASRHG
jgi:hypothetical protein